ncbi:MAG: type II toxin-antitoxin system RelE/ParE family toxin [Pirellulales bacterium]|nr:type II toxin-antitoxin system RelE/ParE family toxin [Pirellulales bacterium]
MTLKSLQDVENALGWFREQRAEAAGAKWFLRLMLAIDSLEQMPERFALTAESADLGAPIRELLVGYRRNTYRVLFEIRGRAVIVLRVWHSARQAVSSEDL